MALRRGFMAMIKRGPERGSPWQTPWLTEESIAVPWWKNVASRLIKLGGKLLEESKEVLMGDRVKCLLEVYWE